MTSGSGEAQLAAAQAPERPPAMTYAWDDGLRRYDFGPGHPLSPIRNALAHKLTRACGIFDLPNVTLLDHVDPATEEDLRRVHEAEYIAVVRQASDGELYRNLARGLGTEDVPIFEGMHEAAAHVCGASLAAAKAIHSGTALHALNISGGLHHAMPGKASGFCIYNDIGVAIAWLKANGVERIAYVDVDVHHGDGVQTMFYNDPDVLTISLHESGRTLFPGTGPARDIGGPNAPGSAVNISLPAGTGDDGWLRAFDAIVPDVLRVFRPQILLTQHGCDSHRNDPLANLRLSIEGQRASYLRLRDLAHELCAGRWLGFGGGGYDWLDVVPRAWTHLAAISAGEPIDPRAPVPDSYRDLVSVTFGSAAPLTMGDGAHPRPRPWTGAYDPLDPLDKAVMKVREAVYPTLGLLADPDPF